MSEFHRGIPLEMHDHLQGLGHSWVKTTGYSAMSQIIVILPMKRTHEAVPE
jgi:hypothetical protein